MNADTPIVVGPWYNSADRLRIHFKATVNPTGRGELRAAVSNALHSLTCYYSEHFGPPHPNSESTSQLCAPTLKACVRYGYHRIVQNWRWARQGGYRPGRENCSYITVIPESDKNFRVFEHHAGVPTLDMGVVQVDLLHVADYSGIRYDQHVWKDSYLGTGRLEVEFQEFMAQRSIWGAREFTECHGTARASSVVNCLKSWFTRNNLGLNVCGNSNLLVQVPSDCIEKIQSLCIIVNSHFYNWAHISLAEPPETKPPLEVMKEVLTEDSQAFMSLCRRFIDSPGDVNLEELHQFKMKLLAVAGLLDNHRQLARELHEKLLQLETAVQERADETSLGVVFQ